MVRRLLLPVSVLLCGLVASLTCRAAYLEEGEEAPAPAGEVRVLPPPRPTPLNPLTDLVRRLEIRPGHTYRGLTVFLLEAPRVEDDTDYLSLDEALRRGALTIREKGAGSVPLLLARNDGGQPVLMLAGEIVAGGKQNRTLRDDILLPPRSGFTELPVYCVERGRWSGPGEDFGISSSMAARGVRAAAVGKQSQRELWASVERYGRQLSAGSATGDLQAVQQAEHVQEQVTAYREAFAECWRPAALGMVVARHGQVLGADIFCNPGVFRKHRRRLLESYAVDCIAAREHVDPRVPRQRIPSPREAERFLGRILRSRFTRRPSPGAGRLLDFSGPALHGTALLRKDVVLHACVLERGPVLITPTPVPMPAPRQRRPTD